VDATVFVESNSRNFLAFKNSAVLIGLADRKNSIADHLGTQDRAGTNFRISQLVQINSIPAAVRDNVRDQVSTCGLVGMLELKQLKPLLFYGFKQYANREFHWLKNMLRSYFVFNVKIEELRFLPVLKDWVSVLSTG
jgi:hypothetical protein